MLWDCLGHLSGLAEKGRGSKTCYGGCGERGNIWPLLGPGAAIEQVFLPATRFFLFCHWSVVGTSELSVAGRTLVLLSLVLLAVVLHENNSAPNFLEIFC